VFTELESGQGAPLRCLWLARYIPYPMDAGAKVYSARLAQSLAQAGASVRLLGFGALEAVPPDSHVEHIAVANAQRSQLRALLSPLPIAAAIDATSSYRRSLEAQLQQSWDAIVLDGYGSGWALPRCLQYVQRHVPRRCVLVHVSHNHEELLWRSMAREAQVALPRRWVLWQNALKVGALERRLTRSVDLLSVITAEDAATLGQQLPPQRVLTLTPGYSGFSAAQRTIDARTPRRVLLVGSFRWVMKQENLTRFVQRADPVLHQHGIELDVVGDVPAELLARLQPQCRATHFHGFVTDIAPFLARARLAVVPEVIGGGFKLKYLDYFFGRVPVVTLSAAAAGLPNELREAMFNCTDLDAMVATLVAQIDRSALLNEMQQRAWAASAALFRWGDRGTQLRQAIIQVAHGWRGAPALRTPELESAASRVAARSRP
jgi:glycosyltransferase involved in cell wall biosynthesis